MLAKMTKNYEQLIKGKAPNLHQGKVKSLQQSNLCSNTYWSQPGGQAISSFYFHVLEMLALWPGCIAV